MTQSLFTDEYFMKQALKQAELAFDKDEVPVGAVIVHDNQIIARAHNLTETLNDPTAHAEMQAFTSATDFLGGKYLQKARLYVTLEPCIMCAGAAYWTQIGTIIFGTHDPKRGFQKVNSPIIHPKAMVKGGVMSDECEQILQIFFKQKR
ncbi:MAG: nucleoside deaminase [Bacteroidales bacterium]|jgi:tRNA(adenine34) deaminase|nr:nucleoside deaminase [Bacteroidales bacterium]